MTTNTKRKSAIVELKALLEDDEDRLRVLRRELEANNEANNKIIFQRMDRLESLVKLGMGWLFAFQLAVLGLVGSLAV